MAPLTCLFSTSLRCTFLRAWLHTRVYAPGTRKNCALSGEKNPALKNSVAGYLKLAFPHPFPFLSHLVQVGRWFRRSVLLHVSRKYRSGWAKWGENGGSGWI